MKLIIDIDENDYEYMKRGYVSSTFNIFNIIKNGTPIPENATNGDVIKALFPNAQICGVVGENLEKSWWNALYQKGGKE